MNTILGIIEKKGGLKKLEAEGHFKIKVKGYMDLSIDFIGKGPNGLPMIAVSHNFIQNGDVMADPDMQVEVGQGLKGPELFPVTYQQSSLSIYQEVYTTDAEGKAVGVRTRLKMQLRSFLRTWGANLRRQGFLAAA